MRILACVAVFVFGGTFALGQPNDLRMYHSDESRAMLGSSNGNAFLRLYDGHQPMAAWYPDPLPGGTDQLTGVPHYCIMVTINNEPMTPSVNQNAPSPKCVAGYIFMGVYTDETYYIGPRWSVELGNALSRGDEIRLMIAADHGNVVYTWNVVSSTV